MKFEFGVYTDVTELAFEVNPAYQQNGYTKIYLCSDTHVFWLVALHPLLCLSPGVRLTLFQTSRNP